MNRNVESHFSQIPNADIQRSRFDRSQDLKFTFNVGELIPFFVEEVLPGDTFDIETSKVVRLQTLLTPVMDNIYLDTYFFFVPNRLVWSHWKNFMGESERAWTPAVTYSIPKITFQAWTTGDYAENPVHGYVSTGDILDYMGIPVGVEYEADDTPAAARLPVSALPLRAYDLIYSEWFRDENLIDPVNVDISDSTLGWYNRTQKKPYKVAKYHDVFTSCLPAPQKGPKVAVQVYQQTDTSIPVMTGSTSHDISGNALHGAMLSSGSIGGQYNTSAEAIGDVYAMKLTGPTASHVKSGFEPTNLYAKLSAGVGIDINAMRFAIQMQKFYEALARGGSRYIEIIAQMFNVQSPDARLQRPEYLGGNRIPISIHQITNQSQGENDFLGDLGAMSLTTDRHSDFVKSFVEHGYIIGLCCARYDHSYPQGLEKFWMRSSREEFYFPVFANLGEEAVYKQELYFTGTYDNDNSDAYSVFGYQERWYDYRYKPNRVAGEMRPGISNTLDSWHFADYYEAAPSLSKEWIQEDKTNVDRTLAVTSVNANQIFCDIYVKNYATRPMPMFSIPGLMDHH